jgi:hypothetical protein
MAGYTRRNFLEMGLKSVLATGIGGSLFSGCTGLGKAKKSLDEVLSCEYYAALTKDWDPIYGPPIQRNCSPCDLVIRFQARFTLLERNGR